MQSTQAQYNFSGVDAKVQQYQKQLGKDAVIMVYKDNKVVYQKTLGECQVTTPAPIGATSQWLTAALVLTLVQEGKLSLDDKISQYLPIFTTYMKSYVTIRQCLEQTLGFRTDKGFVRRLKGYATLEEAVNDIASKREIDFKPGDAYQYSDQGWDIAGRILEVVTKKPFDRLMQDRILRPLGMRNTSFSTFDKAVSPSEGAVSSAADFVKFEQLLLDKGVFNGKQILPGTVVDELLKARTIAATVKYIPKNLEGWAYTYGGWVQQADEQQNAVVITSPGTDGTWPMIDVKNKYSFIVFVKNGQSEQKREMYADIKAAIDVAIGAAL
ncbi:serine hydrolase domain-containing protein [Filimonas lacunae]|nr:serine hydrolase domain-containing protein [Filimonas lacunae]BAV06388.1 beta-lactamase [Filimonas lacunae]